MTPSALFFLAGHGNCDQHKGSCLNAKLYDVPLDELEGLPLQPQVMKKFTTSCFSSNNFMISCRNASAPGS